jgi:hypothetical protein
VTGGWLLYVHLWRDAGAEPLRYRDVTAQLHVQPVLEFARRFHRAEQLSDYVRRSGARGAHVPRIDWARDDALLVASGPRSSTGYALRVVRATSERGRIVVVVRELTPTLRNPGRAQLTYPYRLLVFHRTAKPVVVEWQGRP